MSFKIESFKAAFKQGSGFDALHMSLFIRGTAFLCLLIAVIIAAIHWQKNAASQKNPMAYLIPRYVFISAIVMVFIFILFV